MTDEMVAPLMDNYNIQEENENNYNNYNVEREKIQKDIDNELTNLLGHRRNNEENRGNNYRHNYNRIIDDNINNRGLNINIELNDNHKKGLIFLSFAIQLCIYYIILSKYYDKIDFIKDNIIIFLVISSIIITTIFLIDLFSINTFREMKIIYLILITIVSSIGLFFFLYEISILLVFKNMKILLLISIVMYLTLSVVFLLFNNLGDLELINNAFFSSLILCLILDLIFFHFKKIDSVNFLIIIAIIFILNIVSLFHQNYLFENRNIRIKDIPIIFTYLFMDIFSICLAAFIIYIFKKKKKRNRVTVYNNQRKYALDNIYK